MWNSTTITPPPINSFKAKKVAIDLNAVTLILQNAINTLKSQKILYTESPILSRFVYRMKLKFRQDKGFRFMEKTNKLLKTLTQFDLTSDLTSFLSSMPTKYEKDLYLPTKQMIEYVLVRLQGYAKLLCRIVESSVATAEFMKWRVNLGHFWTIAAAVISVVSRVWYICKYFTQECCHWYNALLLLRDKLDISGVQWLPDDYEFPEDLAKWLQVDWLSEESDVELQPQIDLPVFSLMDDSDDEDVKFCYEYNLKDCFVIDDDNVEDNDVEFIANFKMPRQQQVETITNLEDDNDIEILNANVNTQSDDEDDLGEVVARDNSVICLDDEDQSDSNQNNGNNQKVLEVIDVTNSAKRKRNVNKINELKKDFIEYESETDLPVATNINTSKNNLPNLSPKKKKLKKNATKKSENEAKCETSDVQTAQSQINISNIQDLNNFIKNECIIRKNNLRSCATRNLNESQWNVLLNKLSTLRTNAKKKPKLRKILMKQARKMLSSLK